MQKLLLVILLITAEVTYAQNNNFAFEQISSEHGLSQLTIRDIVQDYLGFMWFATEGGINKFDGYKCKVYSFNPLDPEGLRTTMITSLCQDKNNTLWAGTHGGGLYKFNRGKDKFVYVPFNKGNKTLSGEKIFSLFTSGDNLWIGTRDEGVIKYNLKTETAEKYFNVENGLSSNVITFITGDKQGNIWIGTSNNGINKLSINTDGSHKIEIYEPGNLIINAAADSIGFVWIATTDGVKKINPENGSSKLYPYFEKSNNEIKPGSVFYLYADDKRNTVWAAASGGLLKYSYDEDKFILYNSDKNIILSKYTLRTLYISNKNILWAGTVSGGVFKIDLSPAKFFNYLSDEQIGTAVPGMSIIQDRDGNFWAGTFGNGLFQLDSGKNIIKKLYQGNSNKKTYVYCITEDDEGNIWYGTIFNGLFRYNKKTGQTKNYNPNNSSLNSRGISFLHLDKENNLWAGTHAMGLFKYDKSVDDFIDMNTETNAGFKVSDKGITCIYEDSRGNLWIGTETKGIDRFNKKEKKFINYPYSLENHKGVSHNYVITIKEDSDGTLWIGTYTGGLNKFNYDTETFTYYTVEDGLPNNSIYAIAEDDSKKLWISTNNGISKFDPRKNIFTNYSTPDGLSAKEFVLNSLCKTNKSEIIFGSIDGFIGFYPDEFFEENNDYKIVATNFTIANKPVVVGQNSKLEKNITISDKINLTYKDNIFGFEFVALNYSQQQSIKYAYKMENFDSKWIITTPDKRFATYTNLDPGEYYFRVKVIDRSGNFSKNEASILITISPPYWKTWWFYSLAVLTFASILYSIYKYRINKILELERLRIGIASDLHDDIGATLTKLALKADMIQHELDNEEKSTDLQRISEMSRHAVSTMSDIVWSIDSRNDSFESMINKMKDFAYGILTDKEIKVDFNSGGFEESAKVPIEIRQNLFLIFKEAINNIAKHSNAKQVEINFSKNENEFLLAVRDTGTKFNKNIFKTGHGLKNMKMRSEKIDAAIEFKNENGFTISVKGKIN